MEGERREGGMEGERREGGGREGGGEGGRKGGGEGGRKGGGEGVTPVAFMHNGEGCKYK